MYVKSTPFPTISFAWICTALATGLRFAEIPFILQYLAHAPRSEQDISVFGVVLSIIVAASGFVLGLASITTKGKTYSQGLKESWGLCLASVLLGFALLGVTAIVGNSIFSANEIAMAACSIFLAIIAIFFRRLAQGMLIANDQSKHMTGASAIRLASIIVMAYLFPKEWSSAITALVMICIASWVDTAICMLSVLYLHKRFKRSEHISYSKRDYFRIVFSSLVFTIQNYITVLAVGLIYHRGDISLLVILIAYLNIVNGLSIDIENIVIRYYRKGLDLLRIAITPILVCAFLVSATLFLPIGREWYFEVFQKTKNIEAILGIRWFCVFLIILFIGKQLLKGLRLQESRYRQVQYSGCAYLLGFSAAVAILFLYTPSNYLVAGCVFLSTGLLFEGLVLVFQRTKIPTVRRGALR